MAALTYLGVVSATDRALVGQVINPAGTWDSAPALAVAAGTALAIRLRGAVLGPLAEADVDDDVGFQALVRRIEDLWGGLGPVALVVLPLLTVAALGLAAIGMVLVERRLESRGERAQVPCSRCGQPLHASAPACPHCHAPVPQPTDVGLLGQPKRHPADPRALPYRLVAVKRCPACGTRLRRRAVRQTCQACGHRLMDDPDFARSYIGFIDRRVPPVCLACLLLGLVPVLGVIPGVVAYRLMIVAPYRRYIPAGRGLLVRWGVRLAVVLLVAVQWVPVAGGLALPAMALLNYGAYRSVYRRLALAT
jgi:Zn finger protein HypA/HybF involved in hydrogenase expression